MIAAKPATIMLIAGGPQAKNSEFILDTALKQSPSPRPSLAYIGAASDDNLFFFNMIRKNLESRGASQVAFVPTVKKFNRSHSEEVLAASDLIFVSGGDVAAGMKILQDRDMISLLAELFRSGKPFVGLSAGSIMLCRNWISWRDCDDDDAAELMECLGFAPLLCDVHDEEGGWQELKKLLSFFPEGTKGYGISAGGALLVTYEGKITAVGTPPVRLVRKCNSVVSCKP